MPTSPPSLCTAPGCGTLVYGGGRCPEHLKEARRESDARRPSGYQRGYTPRWAAFSKDYLRRHPLCECAECLTKLHWARPAATDVDHTGGHSRTCPHAMHEQHCMALSHAHHARKTAAEDGSFGRERIKRCGE